MSAPPLSIQNVSRRFRRVQALDGVSFDMQPGEIMGFIGLNGAGKTTLIKTILDLLRPDAGEIRLFGEDTREATARRHIAYLPEKFAPSGYLKGREYLRLALSSYGLALDLKEAEEQAGLLGLKPAFLHAPLRQYSKGMGQKIGLLGALLSQRPLLILDEPMSGLDPQARIQLREALSAYRQAGHAIFFSSHILSDIEQLCDRIAVIHQGRLLFTGAPAAFRDRSGGSLEQAFLDAVSEEKAAA